MLGFIDGFSRREARSRAGWHDASAGAVEDETLRGLLSGSRIATPRGWCAVERITAGAQVLTFDHGVQTVIAVSRAAMPCHAPSFAQPVLVPAAALGNRAPMTLMPEQGVMVESDAAEALFGDPFAILKARDLVGWRGIRRAEPGTMSSSRQCEVVTLHFAAPEVLHVDGGVLVVADAQAPATVSLDLLSSIRLPAPYAAYSGQTARLLVAAMVREEARLAEGDPTSPAA